MVGRHIITGSDNDVLVCEQVVYEYADDSVPQCTPSR